MKKIFYIVLGTLLLTGCGDISNTPTRQVEGFLNKYQTLDRDVIEDLDYVIENEDMFNNENRQKYRDVIKKQYKNLSYKIKEEKIDGDNAAVTVEITVIDFAKVLAEARDYKNNNIDEFKDEQGNYNETLYTDYVIDKLDKAKEKVKYTLDMPLTNVNGKWKLNDIDNDMRDKILGIYEK